MIKLPATFMGFSSRSDGSAGIRFVTQELSPEEFADLKQNLHAFGWVVFAQNVGLEDIPSEDAKEEGISASERLRRRMYVYFKEQEIDGDFDLWRKQQLEKIGDKYLSKLEND
jgi:hypothetical protein